MRSEENLKVRLRRFLSELAGNSKKLWNLMRSPDHFIYVLVAAYALIFSYLTVIRFFAFDYSAAWDLGVFDQSLWTTMNYGIVKGQVFWNTLNFGHLYIHFDPILYLVLPIYGVFQSPVTLLVLQAWLLGLGAIPIYWLARDELKNKTVGLLFAASYLTYAPLTGIAWMFYPDAFVPAFLSFAFYYFQKQKWSRYFVFLILALMSKELITLVTIFLGFYGLWVSRKSFTQLKSKPAGIFRDRRILFSLVTIALSVLWIVIAVNVMSFFTSVSGLKPTGSETIVHLTWWSNFGKDFSSIASTMLLNPIRTLDILKSNLLAVNYMVPNYLLVISLFTPLVLLPLLNPETLLIGFPYGLLFLLSNNPIFRTLRFHYIAPILPFVFISAIYGLKRLSTLYARWGLHQKQMQVKKEFSPRTLKKIMLLVLIVSVFSTLFPIEGGWTYWFHYENVFTSYQMTLHRRALKEVMELVPSNASVLTQNNLFPYLDHRLDIYAGWHSDLPLPEYILVDTTVHWSYFDTPGPNWQYEETVGRKLPDIWSTGDYGVVTAVDGIWLLKKGLAQTVTLEKVISPSGRGLIAEFYSNQEFAGEPVFTSTFFGVGPDQDHWATDWSVLTPFVAIRNSSFSAVFEGFIDIPKLGFYAFESKSMGNTTLYIDGQMIEGQDSLLLGAGFHAFKITYIAGEAGPYLWLDWLPPWKASWEMVPADILYLNPV